MNKQIGPGFSTNWTGLWLAGILALAGGTAWGTLPGATNHVWTTGGAIRGTPAFGDDGAIYIGSMDHNLYAFNPDGTTSRVWTTDGDIAGSPSIGSNGTIYIGSLDRKLWAFNSDGTTNFSCDLGAEIYGTPAIGADGTLYIGTSGKKFFALNPADGATSHVWSAGSYFRGSAAIAADGTIYMGNDDGYLYAFNPDGTTNRVWKMNAQVYHSPTISSNGTIYIGDQAGYFWAFNPDGTTNHVWKLGDMVYHSSASIGADGRIYVGAFSNTAIDEAWCYSLNTDGTTNRVWQLSNEYIQHAPVIGLDGAVFIGSDTNLFGLNPNTGATNILWTMAGYMMGSPAIGPDRQIYIGDSSGNFYSLHGILPMADTYWPKAHQNLKNTGLVFHAPRNVSASDGAYYNRVALTWDAVPQATDYLVYRSPTSSAGTLIGGSTSNSYADISAATGTTYYYWVKATNANFVSALSDYDTGSRAVFILPPRAPGNVRATDAAYSNKIGISWTSVSNAYAYEILRSTVNATGTAVYIGSAVSAAYDDYTPALGTVYYYWVRGGNDGGTGRLSASDSGLRAATVTAPSAPQGVLASDGAYTNKVRVTWSAVSNAASYKVYRSTADAVTAAVYLCDSTAALADDPSVAVGTLYYYWVVAINQAGFSADSASDSGYASATVNAPATPTGLAATKGAYTDRVRLSWTAVANATAYEIYRNPVNDSASATKLEPDAASSPYDDASVAVDTTYYYWVKAKNDAGASGFSAGDSGYAVTTIVAPATPTGLAATKGAYTDRVRLSWTAVSNATAYEVYRNTANDSAAATKLVPDVASPACEDATAVLGTKYYYWIKAKNSAGVSDFSASDSGWCEAVMGVGADYDGDRKADPALYVESTGSWYVRPSTMGYVPVTVVFGGAGSTPCLGDYDGDGKTDPAVYVESTGSWSVELSASGYAVATLAGFGGADCRAVAGDYDGDGKADPAIYDPADGTWQVAMSSAGYAVQGVTGFGGTGRAAVEQNYDSDHRFDAAIYNQTNGNWTVLLSAQNYITATLWAFGGTGYTPVKGDFDGDGLADPAVYNEAKETWQVKLSGSGYAAASLEHFGGAGTLVSAADYDGDGKADPIYLDTATGIWHVKLSANGYAEATLSSGWTP